MESSTNSAFNQKTDRFSLSDRLSTPPAQALKTSNETLEEYILNNNAPSFDRPIFIVAAPRSGSTMLFETLKSNRDIWTINDEMHREVEMITSLHPETRGYISGALTAEDYTSQIGAILMDSIVTRLRSSKGMPFWDVSEDYRQRKIRFLEKTPKNALRIPFFLEMFPTAKFIFLHRDPYSNIGSMIDAWQSGKFVTYPRLPEWTGNPWSLLLPDGWKEMIGRPIADICSWQWSQTNKKVLEDLSSLPEKSWTHVKYEDLLENTDLTLRKLCAFCGIPYGPRMQSFATNGFPNSRYTLTVPDKEKWRRHEDHILGASDIFSEIKTVIQALGK